jgi:hypothetical protein
MFYVIADAGAFGLRLTPDEGADIVRITEMIKAAANEQLPVVHPDQPGFAGITIGQLSGPAHDPANSLRNAVTVSTGTLDWNARRPGPARSTVRRAGPGRRPRWRRSTPAGSWPSAASSATRASSARSSPGGRGGGHDRGVPGDRPVHHGPGLDHRVRQLRGRSHRPVPRRLHGRRHLVADARRPISAASSGG